MGILAVVLFAMYLLIGFAIVKSSDQTESVFISPINKMFLMFGWGILFLFVLFILLIIGIIQLFYSIGGKK